MRLAKMEGMNNSPKNLLQIYTEYNPFKIKEDT